jgi:hypothetical protein
MPTNQLKSVISDLLMVCCPYLASTAFEVLSLFSDVPFLFLFYSKQKGKLGSWGTGGSWERGTGDGINSQRGSYDFSRNRRL